jgi:hypothetical protein
MGTDTKVECKKIQRPTKGSNRLRRRKEKATEREGNGKKRQRMAEADIYIG